MPRVQRGVACAGCPHRAAYVACKEVVGRTRGRVVCGNAGCPAVGEMHPAATACPGGESELLDRYRQDVPTDGSPLDPAVPVCIHFAHDSELRSDDALERFAGLPGEGLATVLAIMASSRVSLTEEGIAQLAETAVALGVADVEVVDPLDQTAACASLARCIETPGVHAVIFAAPCATLQGERAPQPVEIDRYACVGCHRCHQITGCPALVFAPPAYQVDADACKGCDLCTAFCRTHVIYSPRTRMSPDERARLRLDAARGL